MSHPSKADRLATLEESVTHMERFIEDLNKVVYEQTKLIKKLEKKLDAMEENLKDRSDQDSEIPNMPPPHYDCKK